MAQPPRDPLPGSEPVPDPAPHRAAAGAPLAGPGGAAEAEDVTSEPRAGELQAYRGERLLNQDGSFNLRRLGLTRDRRFDLFHQLLVVSWPQLLAGLLAAYGALAAGFALLYRLGGDCLEGLPPGDPLQLWFASCHVLSTLGREGLAPITPWANLVMVAETLSGLLGLALMTGLCYARFALPRARVRFSSKALLSRWEGVDSLVLRVANLRRNQIVDVRVRAFVALPGRTAEGIAFSRIVDLDLVRSESPLFLHAWTVIHPIVPGSPLHGRTSADLAAAGFEVVVCLTGTDASYCQPIHSFTSYRAEDLAWGGRFRDILGRAADGRRTIDFSKLDQLAEPTESEADLSRPGPRLGVPGSASPPSPTP